ncbi:MAG: PA2778 family cysteine peptidase [Geminicoccaceae bacterium]|nr:PA2778 family cysteine peptidase [Geminicoccaceae bacterium]
MTWAGLALIAAPVSGLWSRLPWRGLAAIPLLVLVLMLGGCAGVGLRDVDPAAIGPAATEPVAVRLDVPFVAGDDGHCGPAALASVLRWSGASAEPGELAPHLLTPARGGTLEHDLVGVARASGRLAVPVEGVEPVLREVAAGHPVIVLQNLGLSWYPQWHYAVITGFDLEGRTIVLHSGPDAHRRMALNTFRQTFERAGERGLVVLPPDRLPASAGREAVLRAAAGLERAERPAAALQAYDALLQRWPETPAAHFGIGNAQLALGGLERSAEAFRRAANADSLAAPALNNLAHVSMLRGDLDAAEALAEAALARGGAGRVAAAATLEEVRAARGPG